MICNIETRDIIETFGWGHDRRFKVGALKRKKNGKFTRIFEPGYCREGFCHRAQIHKIYKSSQPLYLSIIHLSAKGKRLVNGLDKAIVVLNYLERQAGWTLSRRMKVVVNGNEDHDYANSRIVSAVRCDPRWKRAPVLLSLLILILRSGDVAKLRRLKIKSEKDIPKYIKVMNSYSSGDGGIVRRTMKNWIPLIKYYNRVFRGIRVADLWKSSAYRSSATPVYNPYLCGIQTWSRKTAHKYPPMIKAKERMTRLQEPLVEMEVEGQ